jgi:hypothetical protein
MSDLNLDAKGGMEWWVGDLFHSSSIIISEVSREKENTVLSNGITFNALIIYPTCAASSFLSYVCMEAGFFLGPHGFEKHLWGGGFT